MPANTTPVFLKTRYKAGFRLQGVFPPHLSPEKLNASYYDAKNKFQVYRQISSAQTSVCADFFVVLLSDCPS